MPDLDPATLKALAAGDPRAQAACYELFGARVHRICLGILGQPSDAEDAVHDVFLKVFERAAQFEGRARLTTWMHRIAVHHCLNRIEERRLRRTDPLQDELARPGAPPDRDLQRAEAEEQVARLLARLPPAQRAVLVLRELEGASYAEIAAALEIPEGTVMSRLARARERLSNLVDPSSPSRPPSRSLS